MGPWLDSLGPFVKENLGPPAVPVRLSISKIVLHVVTSWNIWLVVAVNARVTAALFSYGPYSDGMYRYDLCSCMVVAYAGMAYAGMAYAGMAYVVKAFAAMAHTVSQGLCSHALAVMAYALMAYAVMADMAYVVLAFLTSCF